MDSHDDADGEREAPSARVVIADDHPLFRGGVRERLEKPGSGIQVVGEASDGQEACELVRRLHPDVVLLDIAMPVLSGIDATRRIKAELPDVGVLILTLYDDEQYIYALVDAGAAGYLLKTTEGEQLAEAVHRVRQGEAVLSPAVTQKVLKRMTRDRTIAPEAAPSLVSERELEVLQLAARGAGNKSIANELGVSIRTVHAHMRHIFNKLGVASRTEAVMRGVREGWLKVRDDG
jgi:DNA-binding NarL/FixJ family response regulator